MPETFGKVVNNVVMGLGIIAAAVLLFFFIAAIVSLVYRGKTVGIKVLKKHEVKFKKRRTRDSRLASRGGRYQRSKIDVEIDGDKKTLKCNDFVILDKLSVGGKYNVRVKFGAIIKILK